MKPLLAALLLLGTTSAWGEALPFGSRVWKSADGRSLSATLVKADVAGITLRLPEGRDVDLRADQLSAEDHKILEAERKHLAAKLTQAKPASGSPTTSKPIPGKSAPKAAPGTGLLSLDSVTASKVFRLGVSVPGKGGGCFGKMTGKVIGLTSVRGKDYPTIIVELEGGVLLAAPSYDSVWGGSKWNLQVLNGELHKLPSNQPAPPSEAPKDSKKKDDPAKKGMGKGKTTKLPDKKAMQRKRLFGVGDTISITGQLHLASEVIGKQSGFSTRGFSKLTVLPPPAAPTKK